MIAYAYRALSRRGKQKRNSSANISLKGHRVEGGKESAAAHNGAGH